MTRHARGTLALTLLLSIAAGGCGKQEAAAGGAAAATGAAAPAAAAAPFHAAIVARLKDEGFTVGKLEKTAPDAYGAGQCLRGEVDQLDVLLCEYSSAAAATGAEKQLNAFASGAVSGASRRVNTVAMVVADRKQVDLPGKRISRVLKTFAPPAAAPAAAAPAAPVAAPAR